MLSVQPLVSKCQPSDPDGGFDQFLIALRARWAEATRDPTTPLFRVGGGKIPEMFPFWLSCLPEELRQHYTCNCCRHFMERFGALAIVDSQGGQRSAVWPAAEAIPVAFKKATYAIHQMIAFGEIQEAFLTKESVLGIPETRPTVESEPWTHLAVQVPASHIYRNSLLDASQGIAAITEERKMLIRGLDEFPAHLITRAHTMLSSGSFYRPEKGVAMLAWLMDLRLKATAITRSRNLLWVAAATAPAGFCHVKSGMVGTLLEDLQADLPVSDIQRRWQEKMAPETYQRAQVAPAAGNIAQAEKIIAGLKATGSLARRFATPNEIPIMLWVPKPEKAMKPTPDGVFKNVVPKAFPKVEDPALIIPTATMTFAKFRKSVLPNAHAIDVLGPTNSNRFMALVTAIDPAAPPILQWDHPARRNPISWYYSGGIDGEIRRRVSEAGGRVDDNDIRISLAWNNRNDLDIHVFCPNGDHIFFGNKRPRHHTGGWLDVDMNIAGETSKAVENICFPRGEAKPGRYRVIVENFRFHESHRIATPFLVELEVNGEVHRFAGSVVGGDHGRGEMGVPVCEFTYGATGTTITAQAAADIAAPASSAWGVTPGTWTPVIGITSSPNLWGDPSSPQFGEHTFFLLDGCQDSSGRGRGFLTETLRPEFRPIRSTLEAFVTAEPLPAPVGPVAAGLGFAAGPPWGVHLRVRSPGAVATYLIDRAD